ncbi:hypothetical protein THAOC_02187 [Thalassiosira oceanica]|uniref:Cyclin-like domain-containing protein n=1 Tax=Thalassiosira oceanica TaxID=159749 RepID=K0TF75_THAOC|nr:hypothetical protein THAOC_02187 [Thalassiosira oceanica]|mmetsp:Transcript_30513/g.69644  ORF Transcript_30513/g.69644 Transcript_30513/m.69644 type:complete len:349 (-) Transcript_30513:89-1135(-)|eukprot:EJK76070.1 hypothetical protein THAOC_02187 [Thalassiosira oceanica]
MPGLTMITTREEDAAALLASSPMSSVAELTDRISVLMEQESTYMCRDFLGGDGESSSSPPNSCARGPQEKLISSSDRAKMIEWSFQVCDFCKFQRETVSRSSSYLDRFLSTTSPRALKAKVEKRIYQLCAMTSLYIAVKLFEPLAMDASLLSEISHGCYEADEILSTETEILAALQWRVSGCPISHDFVHDFLALLPPSAYHGDETTAMTILDFSRFQCEIAVCDNVLSMRKKSTVALAAILNSIEGVDESLLSADSRFRFFKHVSKIAGVELFTQSVNAARTRLLDLFSANSGFEMPQIANLTPIGSEERYTNHKLTRRSSSDTATSPVCVSWQNFAGERGRYARCA